MKKLYIILAIVFAIAIPSVYALVEYFAGTAGISLTDGQFMTDGTGNAGQVQLDFDSSDLSRLDGNSLIGSFWIQTVGTGTFDAGSLIQYTGTGNPTLDCWSVIGTASSVNAGTIELSIPGITNLFFNPVSRKLEGYGWNNGVGRVPFGSGSCAGTDIAIDSAGFIGRVKIVGNIGGTTIFSTLYDQGVKFDASLFNSTLQRIRKNVSVLSRNLSSTQMNTTFTTTNTVAGTLFYINTGSTLETQSYQYIASKYTTDEVRTLVIIGGDFYVDADIDLPMSTNPKGIIVLKNDLGVGGNVYIHQDVKNIQSTIFAEGTIYSGESSSIVYNDTPSELTALPPRQLYVQGALLSRNTIGGASKSKTEVICPYGTTCTFIDATKYDLNYFRAYDSTDFTNNRAYMRNGVLDDIYDDYSVIIEYDSRLISTPPPGFE